MSDLNMHINRPGCWIEVTGEDSFTFLQGQSTNDLRKTLPTPVTYTLWLDRKGKVLADSFVLQEGPDRFFLYSYGTPATVLLERLESHIIADEVVLRDLTSTATSAVIWGARSHEVLAQCGWERPERGSFSRTDHRFLVPGRRSRRPNIDLIVTGDDNEETFSRISAAVVAAGGALTDQSAVERERIESAIPSVPDDVGPRDLPQEGNLEEAAISYTKGCYLGQEVMARIRSMDQVRRNLVQVQLNQEDGERPTDLPCPLYDGSREAGSLRTLAGPPPWLGLALVRRDVLENNDRLALSPDGPSRATVKPVTIL